MKKVLLGVISLMAICSFPALNSHINGITFSAAAAAPNKGDYTRTSQSVTVYTESGARKGTYPVYLHQGKKYIDFNNTWICIQGKQRFSYMGNNYVIK